MRLDEIFYQWASNNTNLTDLVGENIDPQHSDQKATGTRLTYKIVGSYREVTTSGLDTVFEDVITIDVFDQSYSKVMAVTDVLIKEFHALRADPIQGAFLEDQDQSYNDKNKTHQSSLDFTVFYCP